ncbi:hypothetical protein Tco_0415278 [Tanacetum coccineum]
METRVMEKTSYLTTTTLITTTDKHGVPPTKRLFRVAMLDPSQGFIDPWGKFVEIWNYQDRSLLALRPSRHCAQARSEEGMPFHTQSCKEYTDGIHFKPRFDTSTCPTLYVGDKAVGEDGQMNQLRGNSPLLSTINFEVKFLERRTHRRPISALASLFCTEILKRRQTFPLKLHIWRNPLASHISSKEVPVWSNQIGASVSSISFNGLSGKHECSHRKRLMEYSSQEMGHMVWIFYEKSDEPPVKTGTET